MVLRYLERGLNVKQRPELGVEPWMAPNSGEKLVYRIASSSE